MIRLQVGSEFVWGGGAVAERDELGIVDKWMDILGVIGNYILFYCSNPGSAVCINFLIYSDGFILVSMCMGGGGDFLSTV